MRRTLCLLLLLAACGCTMIAHQVSLEYLTPQYDGPAVQGTVYIKAFTDGRADKTRVGFVADGTLGETADVTTPQDVALWISNAVAMELEAAGFTVNKVDAYDKAYATGGNIFIDGNVLNVFTATYPRVFTGTFTGNVELEILLLKDGKQYLKAYQGKSEKIAAAVYASLYKDCLEQALNQVALQVITDITALVGAGG